MVCGVGNRVDSFKGRGIDLSKKVKVYRNLTRKGKVYSIQQGGLVVGTTDCIMLNNVKFTVSKKTQERVRLTKQRNVHAYAVGYISIEGEMGTTAEEMDNTEQHLPLLVTYNPYNDSHFRVRGTEPSAIIYVLKSPVAMFNRFGLSVCSLV
jgi:hypothetical protein